MYGEALSVASAKPKHGATRQTPLALLQPLCLAVRLVAIGTALLDDLARLVGRDAVP
jgi:hypothetical protein